jgi:hypothetical protein
MAIYKPPFNIALRDRKRKSVFLAGSIEMGVAEDWQTPLQKKLHEAGYDVFNPRRDEWNSSWEQKFTNPQFYQQVTWELTALEQADYIIMYFDPKTNSIISNMELGAHKDSGKIYVVCPDGYCRKGNVEIFCNFYNIPFYNNIDTLLLDFNL